MKTPLTLIGRSSSHFTRVARLYAAELEVPHDFSPVFDIASTSGATFGDNPALRVPSLRTPEGTWFGTLAICRELARRSPLAGRLVWPEDLSDPLTSNAQELVLDAMETEVAIIMGRVAGIGDDHAFLTKPFARLRGMVAWLDTHLDSALARLPERRLSYLEATAYAFTTHVEFRGIMPLDAFPKLVAFRSAFGARPCAERTPLRFDQPPSA
jgi:glutathione S-transferase